jgi:hypothetical protein
MTSASNMSIEEIKNKIAEMKQERIAEKEETNTKAAALEKQANAKLEANAELAAKVETAEALQAKADADMFNKAFSRKVRKPSEPKFNEDGSPKVRKARAPKFNEDGSRKVRKTRKPNMDGSRNYLTMKEVQARFSGIVNNARFTEMNSWRSALENKAVIKHMAGKGLTFEEEQQEKALEAMHDLCVVLKKNTSAYINFANPHEIDNQSRVTCGESKGGVPLSSVLTITKEAIALYKTEPQGDGEEDEAEQEFLNRVKKGHTNLSRVLEAITPFLPKNQTPYDVLEHMVHMLHGFLKQGILPTYVIGGADGYLVPCEIIDFKHYKPAWQRRTPASLLEDGQRSAVGKMSAFRSEPKPVSEDKPVSSRKRRKGGVDTDDSAQVTPAMAIIVVDDDRPAKVSKGSPTVSSPPVPPVPEFSDPSVQAVLAQAYPV